MLQSEGLVEAKKADPERDGQMKVWKIRKQAGQGKGSMR
jgi:hypothetical protein